jgi:uncharacterized pyridoxal phosphate-containing UPF0001 family protein
MPDIAHNLISLKKELHSHVKLVAISKTKTVDDILEAYNTGHRIFGENRVQELTEKKEKLPGDIEWHFVGHLQSNKVKYIAPFITMIQSVDTFRLLTIINKEAFRIQSEEFRLLHRIRLCGVMGMATFTDNHEQVREEFKCLFAYFNELKNRYFHNQSSFREISMGMSDDYRIAIEEGSTMIRIGSIIFGERM